LGVGVGVSVSVSVSEWASPAEALAEAGQR